MLNICVPINSSSFQQLLLSALGTSRCIPGLSFSTVCYLRLCPLGTQPYPPPRTVVTWSFHHAQSLETELPATEMRVWCVASCSPQPSPLLGSKAKDLFFRLLGSRFQEAPRIDDGPRGPGSHEYELLETCLSSRQARKIETGIFYSSKWGAILGLELLWLSRVSLEGSDAPVHTGCSASECR